MVWAVKEGTVRGGGADELAGWVSVVRPKKRASDRAHDDRAQAPARMSPTTSIPRHMSLLELLATAVLTWCRVSDLRGLRDWSRCSVTLRSPERAASSSPAGQAVQAGCVRSQKVRTMNTQLIPLSSFEQI